VGALAHARFLGQHRTAEDRSIDDQRSAALSPLPLDPQICILQDKILRNYIQQVLFKDLHILRREAASVLHQHHLQAIPGTGVAEPIVEEFAFQVLKHGCSPFRSLTFKF